MRLILEKNNGKENFYTATLNSDLFDPVEPIDFRLSLTDTLDKNGSFNDSLTAIRGGTVSQDDLEIVGTELYNLVIGEHFGKLLQDFHRPTENKKVRLQLDIRDPELITLPWELLKNERQFLRRDGVSIVRFTPDGDKSELELDPNQVKVLIVSASPKDYPTFDEDSYTQIVKDSFEQQHIKCEILMKATRESLLEKCSKEERYDLFHFVGHGDFAESNGGIVLRKEDDSPEIYPAPDLGTLLRDCGVKFAFLCSCETGQTSKENQFRGVAQNLIGAGIPVVLAMQYDIVQEEAKKFVEKFYQNLLGTESGNIIDEAIPRLLIKYEDLGWCVPVLYAQYSVGKLLASPSDPVAIELIVRDILSPRTLIPFLGPGINPVMYRTLSDKLVEMVKQDIRKHQTNSKEVKTKKELIRDIIGLPCWGCHYFVEERLMALEEDNQCPMIDGMRFAKEVPRREEEDNQCPIIDGMRRKADKGSYIYNLKNDQDLIVAKNNILCLSQYLFDPDAPYLLYEDLRKNFEAKKYETNENLLQIRKLLVELPSNIQLTNNSSQPNHWLSFPVIMTTCWDQWLEKACFNQDQDYDVIFYKPNNQNGEHFWHKPYDKSTNDSVAISKKYKGLPFDQNSVDKGKRNNPPKRPIIIQLFGRWDSDFVITDYQFDSLMKSLKSLIQTELPNELTLFLQDCHPLFIGYSPNDPELHNLVDIFNSSGTFKYNFKTSWLLSQTLPGMLGDKFLKDIKIKFININSLQKFVSEIEAEITNQN